MTLEQLKSLKVGDVVRYTNKEDASDCTDWRVDKISTNYVDFIDMGKNGNYMVIYFNDQDIQHIASTLALVENTTNELQIILHQIRDCEFDITHKFGDYGKAVLLLTNLRNKRDTILNQQP
jgi:hypothetical protein